MEIVIIKLDLIDKVRLVASSVNTSAFIGMIAPYIRKEVDDGGLFMIHGDPQNRTFRYIIQDGREYITDDGGGRIPLNKGRSLTGVIMDKLTNNEFSRSYRDMKESYSNLLKGVD